MKFWFEIIASGRFVIPYLPTNKKCFDRPTCIRIHTFFYRSKCNRTNYSGKWSQSASIQCVLIFHVSPNTPQSFVRPFRHRKEKKQHRTAFNRYKLCVFSYLFHTDQTKMEIEVYFTQMWKLFVWFAIAAKYCES